MHDVAVSTYLRALSIINGVPEPAWRWSEPNVWLEDADPDEWYDGKNHMIVIARDTNPDLSGVRHEFLHYFCQEKCPKFGPPYLCTEELADTYMNDVHIEVPTDYHPCRLVL